MAQNPARKIMIIRHAEKPDGVNPGITESGVISKHDLTIGGWQRAGALACFFGGAPTQAQEGAIARPQFLFASAASNVVKGSEAHESRSARSVDTLLPLGRKLQIEINTSFRKGEEEQVAAAAQQCPGVVLISWQHEAISAIGGSLLPVQGPPLPKWPPTRFDLVYVFDLDDTTGKYRFSQVPQCLLAGDSEAGNG